MKRKETTSSVVRACVAKTNNRNKQGTIILPDNLFIDYIQKCSKSENSLPKISFHIAKFLMPSLKDFH